MAAEGVWRAANVGCGSQAAPLLSSQPAAPPAASPPQNESAIWSVAVTGSGSKTHARAGRGATLSGGLVQWTSAVDHSGVPLPSAPAATVRWLPSIEQSSMAGNFPGEACLSWRQVEGRCSPPSHRLRCSVVKQSAYEGTKHTSLYG